MVGLLSMQVDDTLDLFNDLELQHQAVATKTKTLHVACDRLVWFYLCCSLYLYSTCLDSVWNGLSFPIKTMNLKFFNLPSQLIEKQRLIEFADALRSKLKYFDELENVRFECNLFSFGYSDILYFFVILCFSIWDNLQI